MNGRRLTAQEIAERFGAMKREHEKGLERSAHNRRRREQRNEARDFLSSQESVSVGSNVGDSIRDADLGSMRDAKTGRFMGVGK